MRLGFVDSISRVPDTKMFSNPIIRRELFAVLRTRKALFLQAAVAGAFAVLVLLRWPSDALVDLSGAQSRQVFQVFGYGMLAMVCLLAPVFPAASIVRERNQGTLTLLLTSPMKPWSIYFGKLIGVLAFAGLLLLCTLPSAVACYTMGGVGLTSDIGWLYALFVLAALQMATLALVISSWAQTTDSALRMTYALVLTTTVGVMGPHQFLQGKQGNLTVLADWVRCFSPLPAVMETLGHGDAAGQGLITTTDVTGRYAVLALLCAAAVAALTIWRLAGTMVDRPRSQGIVTEDRSRDQRAMRRMFFLVDPQRRKQGIGWLNPVMVKEFRCRRFGRMHWLLRLIAVCAVCSLGLTWVSAGGTESWGVETIGGLMVLLQVALIVLITPALASGLISAERESGGWQLLQMTPLSGGAIFRGKLLSVAWTMLLVMLATLPGYLVMVYINPQEWVKVSRVLVCLLLTAIFALTLSAAVSGFFRRTAQATVVAYSLLSFVCAAPLLIWLGRDAPFGRRLVESVLVYNPIATALSEIDTPGFTEYHLLPANWYILGTASAVCLLVLRWQIWRLTRPR